MLAWLTCALTHQKLQLCSADHEASTVNNGNFSGVRKEASQADTCPDLREQQSNAIGVDQQAQHTEQ